MDVVLFGVGIAVILALTGAGMFGVVIYNRLVALRNRAKNAFAQIDVQLRRRYDLIPNLVEAAKGYLKHERKTLEAVIKARSEASKVVANVTIGSKKDMAQLAKADGALTSALGRLLAVFEKYPDLKGNQNVLRIQDELTRTEDAVAFSRKTFNDFATGYNTQQEVFPDMLFARVMGFNEVGLLEADEEQRAAPKVQF